MGVKRWVFWALACLFWSAVFAFTHARFGLFECGFCFGVLVEICLGRRRGAGVTP